MGSFPICWENSILRVGFPLWWVQSAYERGQISLSSSVPFLIMGRVTYLHHYVCSSLSIARYKPHFFCFVAANAVLLRLDAFARPWSFHFLLKAIHKANKKHSIRSTGVHHHLYLLVVQRSCFRNHRTYRRTQGTRMEEGMWPAFFFFVPMSELFVLPWYLFF